jgi:hypothetical protein
VPREETLRAWADAGLQVVYLRAWLPVEVLTLRCRLPVLGEVHDAAVVAADVHAGVGGEDHREHDMGGAVRVDTRPGRAP